MSVISADPDPWRFERPLGPWEKKRRYGAVGCGNHLAAIGMVQMHGRVLGAMSDPKNVVEHLP